MQIVSSTLIVFAFLGLMLVRGPYRGIYIMAVLQPFGMMAVFNLPAVGGTSIVAIDMAILTMFALILIRKDVQQQIIRLLGMHSPAFFLLLFLAYAVVATMFFPRVFAGATEVFGMSRENNQDGIVSTPLGPGSANLSQLFRVCLSLCAFLVMAVVQYRRPRWQDALLVVKIMTGVHVALGIADIVTNSAGMAYLLAPIRTANYALTLGQNLAGLNRMMGGYPEASAYGFFAVGLFAFWLSYWYSNENKDRAAAIFLLLSAFAVLRCTSSSAYVGTAGFIMVFTVYQMSKGGALISMRTSGILVTLVACVPLVIVGAYSLYELVPGVTGFIDRSLLNKLQSDSGVERMSWNVQGLINFWETKMLGAGLGSVRASNWLVSTLATVGLPGVFALLAFLYSFVQMPTAHLGAAERRVVIALKMGCVGLWLRLMVVSAVPDMQVMFFMMAGMAVGITLSRRDGVAAPDPDFEFDRAVAAPTSAFVSVRRETL